MNNMNIEDLSNIKVLIMRTTLKGEEAQGTALLLQKIDVEIAKLGTPEKPIDETKKK